MTNQEASKIIKDGLDDMSIDYTDEEQQEALTMAIFALEQEPREDATLKDIFCMGCEYKEQEPKTGHWITKEAYSEDKAMGITEQIVCSNCDMQNSYFSEWDECKNPISKTFIRSKFCPNCGAKMVEPQESEK